MRFRLWAFVNRVLRRFGYELRKARPVRMSVEAALRNVRSLGLSPATVVDIGASDGGWSLRCAAIFPHAHYVLVEPLSEFVSFLGEATTRLGNAHYRAVLASSFDGEATLYVHRDLVGSSTYREHEVGLESETRRIEALTLDTILRQANAQPPYLLKLDVQGAELEVLAGAAATLPDVSLIVLEASFFEFFEGGPDFAAVVERLAAYGFALYDVLGVSYRPFDGALAQADLLFVPRDSTLRAHHVYAQPHQRAAQDARFRAEHARRRGELRGQGKNGAVETVTTSPFA
jgi:FkbM family methyltransferase